MTDEELPPLLTLDDLSAYDIEIGETALVHDLISAVSAGIRDAAGAPITKATSTLELHGRNDAFLALPVKPVRSVAQVEINGQAIDDYKIRDGRLWRKARWGNIEDDIQVIVTHGYDKLPADVRKLAINLVAAGLNEATSEEGLAARRGLVSRGESIDGFYRQESFVRGEDEVVDLTEIPDRTKRWLRERFGEQAFVTGED